MNVDVRILRDDDDYDYSMTSPYLLVGAEGAAAEGRRRCTGGGGPRSVLQQAHPHCILLFG